MAVVRTRPYRANPAANYIPVVQSLNSPFFPPHIGAEPGWAKRESRITCMRLLRTNQSKITRPLSIRVHTTTHCSRQCVEQCLFQLALVKKTKNIFFDVDIVVKNKLKFDLSWSVVLSSTSTRHYSFLKHFFVLFLHVERVCKSFIMQCEQFQVGVGVFSCQQILTRISLVIFDIVVKTTTNDEGLGLDDECR